MSDPAKPIDKVGYVLPAAEWKKLKEEAERIMRSK